MANLHRGEIEVELGGARRTLVLTLGALAELEAAFDADDMVSLAERFGAGRLKARDLIRIIGAGLRGAGETVGDDEVAAMTVDGGASGYVRIAAESSVGRESFTWVSRLWHFGQRIYPSSCPANGSGLWPAR